MGSCVSLNYCNRGQSSRSRDGRNNRDTPECNPQETADVSPAPVTPVNSGNTGRLRNDHRSPSYSNLTSNSYQSTASNPNSLSNNNNAISSSGQHFVPPTGKNKRLKRDYLKYLRQAYDSSAAARKMTEAQLQAKREEFWHTAPAFDGKPEIWAALKAACDALESRNYQLAQAIIDSANIILPNGIINDCYDELGNRYQLPVYVLVKPSVANGGGNGGRHRKNSGGGGGMVELNSNELESESSSKAEKNATAAAKKAKLKKKKKKKKNKGNRYSDDDDENNDAYGAVDFDDEFDEDNDEDEDDGFFYDPEPVATSTKSKKSKSKPSTSNKLNGNKKDGTNEDEATNPTQPPPQDENLQIKFRISSLNQDCSGSDVKMVLNLNENVLNVKKKLNELYKIEPADQRFYFAGKPMRDKDRLRVHKLKKNVVIQVVVREKDVPAVTEEKLNA